MPIAETLSLSEVIEGIRRPRRALIELNRIYHERAKRVDRIQVMDKDWDNLVILDACRYDLFEAANTIDGTLREVISGGSSTREFLEYNFAGRSFPDTVYVSANPQLELHGFTDAFHYCDRLWEDCWDEDFRTVRPEITAARAEKSHEEFPKKRLVVHFVQPHTPFIGETGQQFTHAGFAERPGNRNAESSPVWDQIENGELDKEIAWRAYRENLELTLPHVERLIDLMVGKTVITSDHGNAFGEFGVYGHPGNHYLDVLVRVPWLEVDFNERKDIVEDDRKIETDSSEGIDIEERLSDLGYIKEYT